MEFGLRYWIFVAGVVVLSYLIAFTSRKVLARAIRKRSEQLNEDPTKFVFLKNSISLIALA